MDAAEITRKDLTVTQLCSAAARALDTRQTWRILAIAMIVDGHTQLVAAYAGGVEPSGSPDMDQQTLRD